MDTEGVVGEEQGEVSVGAPVPAEPSEEPYASFEASRSRGFRKRDEWVVCLWNDVAEFHCEETGERIRVPKAEARSRILFQQSGLFGGTSNIVTVKEGSKGQPLTLDAGDKSRLQGWFPPKTRDEMSRELRNWGIGLIVLGVLHLVLSAFLDPAWGAVIIAVGVLNLLIRRRGMFIVNGLALIVVGILNIASICSALSAAGAGSSISAAWVMAGLFQIGWGVQEIRKYAQYTHIGVGD